MSEADGGNPMMQMIMGQEGMRTMVKHIEGRLAFLKTELKTTDAQLPLWNAFAQGMRDNAMAMPAMPHAIKDVREQNLAPSPAAPIWCQQCRRVLI